MKKTELPEILDLTSNTTSKMMDQWFFGTRAWIKEELSESDWKIKFTREALEEIRTMTDRISANPLPIHLREPGEFKIPELRRLFSKAKKNSGARVRVLRDREDADGRNPYRGTDRMLLDSLTACRKNSCPEMGWHNDL